MKRIFDKVKNDFWILLSDFIAVNASYFIALIIRSLISESNFELNKYLSVFYRFAPIYTIICIVIFFIYGLYGGIWMYAGIHDMNRIIAASFVTCVIQVLGTITFFERMPVTYYAIGAVLQFLLITLVRFSYRIFVVEQRNSRKKTKDALIVGNGDVGYQLLKMVDNSTAYRCACIINTKNSQNVGKTLNGLPVYGMARLNYAINRFEPVCIFFAGDNSDQLIRKQVLNTCKEKNIEFRDYSRFYSFIGESDSLTGITNTLTVNDIESGKRIIPFSPPDISESEIEEVAEALRSGWITTGPRTKLLERRLAAYLDTGETDIDCDSQDNVQKYSDRVVCLNSATAAEELNLRILGIGPGDEVIVPAYTYTASASAVIHCGATVKFIDIQKDGDPVTHMPEMDYEKLEAAINEKTKAIITVDLGGIVCDYDRIFEIVEKKRDIYTPMHSDGTPLNNLSAVIQRGLGCVAIVADCAHSLGASRVVSYTGEGETTPERRYCGRIAHFSSFSFHAVKNFTTAEGGASTWCLPKSVYDEGVSNKDIYKMYQLLSLHGQNKDALAKTKVGAWEYDIIGPWYKCNMTDIMAAIGLRQLDRYLGLLDRRVEMMKRYDAACDELRISHMIHHVDGMDSSNHLYLIRIPEITVDQRNEIIEKMAELGVVTNVHYKPMPMMTAYKTLGWNIKDFPNTYDYYLNLITLPFHTLLSDEDVEYVCECLRDVVG